MFPELIVLARPEAIDVLIAVDDAQGLLVHTDYLVALLQLEDTWATTDASSTNH